MNSHVSGCDLRQPAIMAPNKAAPLMLKRICRSILQVGNFGDIPLHC